MKKQIVRKYKSLDVTVRAVIWFTICNFILKGISFISSFIFTRMMSQEEYGILSIFLSCEQVFLILSTWEIQVGAYTRGLYKYKEENTAVFTSSMLLLVNSITVLFFVVIFILRNILYPFTGMNTIVIIFMSIYFLFYPAYVGWITRKRIIYDYKPVVAATLVFAVINLIVPILSLRLIKRTANIKYVSSLIASSLFCFFFWFKSSHYLKLTNQATSVKKYWKYMFAYETPLLLHSLSIFLLNQSDRIMIGKLVSKEAAALYSLAYGVALLVTILYTSIEQVITPWRYQKLDEGNYKQVGEVSTLILLVFGSVILLYILVAPDIILLLYPSSYKNSIWCLPPITTSVFFMLLYSLFVGIETYYEQTNYVLYVSLTCGIINLILNYYGIMLFGYIACAYSTLLSYLLFSFGHYVLMKRTLKKKNITSRIYNTKSILLIGAGVLLLSFAFTAVYDSRIVRYCFALLICLVLFIKRGKIIALAKRIKNDEVI